MAKHYFYQDRLLSVQFEFTLAHNHTEIQPLTITTSEFTTLISSNHKNEDEQQIWNREEVRNFIWERYFENCRKNEG